MLFLMRTRKLTRAVFITALLAITTASAADSSQLEQQAKSQLRKADSYMGNGNYVDAKIWLQDAADSVKELQAADPENHKVETFQLKINAMVDGLRRSTGEEMDVWGAGGAAVAARAAMANTTENTKETQVDTPTSQIPHSSATSAVEQQAAAPPVSSKKLPYAARQKMEVLQTQFRNIESSYGYLDDFDVSSTNTKQLLEDIPELIDGLQPLLDQAEEVAANEGVTSHADFDAAQARIDEQPARFEAAYNDILAQREGAIAGKASIQADADNLKSEYNRLERAYFQKAKGSAIYANDLPPIEQLLVLIEEFENSEQAEAEALLNDFSAKYGSTQAEIDQAAKAASLNQDMQLGYAYTEFRNGVDNVSKTRQAEYQAMIERITMMAGDLGNLGDFYRLDAHDEYREWMALAGQFAPDEVDALEQSGYLENILNNDEKAFFERIETVTWPGSTDDDNSEAALAYFRESNEWGRDPGGALTPIGILVEGQWSVQKRDLLDRPTMYGIPAQVVVQMEEDKAQGLARVFNVTLKTQESSDPQQSPPFVANSVGDSWFIKADKVK